MFGQWIAFGKRIRSYFRAYGGFRGVLASPIFGLAVIITALSYKDWLTPAWPEKTEMLIPSLPGFSLGTYAILFSLISLRLKGALRRAKSENGTSYLESLNATFFHFIFVQVIALIWAILFNGTWLFDLAMVARSLYTGGTYIFFYSEEHRFIYRIFAPCVFYTTCNSGGTQCLSASTY